MAMPGPRHVSASVYHRDLDQNLPRPLSDIPEATQSQEASQVSLLSHISHLSSRISQASLTSHRLPSTPQKEKNPTTRAAWTVHNTRMRQRQSLVGWVGCSAAGRKWIGDGRTRSHRTSSMAVSVGDDGKSARPYPDILRLVQPEPRPWTRPRSRSLTSSSTSTPSSTTSFPPPRS
jgi:hypothetical protein